MGSTLFDKIWAAHVVSDLGDGYALLHVSRHLLHDGGGASLKQLAARGMAVRNPDLSFATIDHVIPTTPGRTRETTTPFTARTAMLREYAAKAGIRLFDVGEPGQGIIHVIAPEQGISLPGSLIVCGDSHTCTHGGLGAIAFGIGATELLHVLATQTLVQRKPKRMRVRFDGERGPGVTAKDMVLHLIGQVGAAGGVGYAVEYAGAAVRALSVEERLTLCNLSIELGAKIGLIAPDETTYEYLHGRPYAPAGAEWDAALAWWRDLPSDDDAVFDREVVIDMAAVAPQITWGTNPEQVAAVDQRVPDPAAEPDPVKRQAMLDALDYMGLVPGAALTETPVDWVFIGSCTNSRLSDLQAAASVARGRRVAPGVTAWVVPGSEAVKRAAEAEGLDRVFRDAGFDWREPGCSMCLAMNGETVPRGQRSVSTSNRNFVGRQGPGARTHLASPAMAAAAAVTGHIADVRSL